MKKLTVEKAQQMLEELRNMEHAHGLSLRAEYYVQALEISVKTLQMKPVAHFIKVDGQYHQLDEKSPDAVALYDVQCTRGGE